MLLLVAACARSADPPVRPEGPALVLDPPVRWALADTTEEQHHATVTTLPNGGAAVAWTHRHLWDHPECWLVRLDSHGAWVGDPIQLGAGLNAAAKPDVETDDQGRLWVGYDAYDAGVGLDRVEPEGAVTSVSLGDAVHAVGNNSVDVALTADGGALATWLVEGDEPYYTARPVDPALVPGDPVLRVPLDPTNEDGYTASPPDVEAAPDGGAVIALAEDGGGTSPTGDAPPLRLVLERLTADGEPAGEPWTVAEGSADQRPARPTVAITRDGLAVVAWREREHVDPTTATDWLGAFDPDGAWALPPLLLDPGFVADDAVLALLGDDAVLVAWSRMLDPALPDLWSVWAGVWSLPDGAPLVAPTRLSSPDVAAADRPHVAATADGDGWRFAVSWEQQDRGAPLVTWGRTGAVRLPVSPTSAGPAARRPRSP